MCDRYEASGSNAWNSTMDVRSRPGWLKNAENKVFESKPNPGFEHAAMSLTAQEGGAQHDEQPANGDDDHASVMIEITPFPSNPERPLSSPSPSRPLDHIEKLKKHQEAQMQSLFDEQKQLAEQQTQIAHQQALLLTEEQAYQQAQLEARRENQLSRSRELEQIERERDRLQALQHEQLMKTELVLEQQRHYLDTQGSQDLFIEGCDVQCAGTAGSRIDTSSAAADGRPNPGGLIGGGCFSTEI